MPQRTYSLFVLVGLAAFCARAHGQAPAAATTQDASAQLTWPRTFETNAGKVVVYQPQLESWEGNRLQARAAVAVTPAGAAEPAYGAIFIAARTDVDKANRMVALEDLKITKAQFPNQPGEEQKYLEAIRQQVPAGTRDVPLDHLEASLAMTQARQGAKGVEVKNNPPKIIFSTTPALLVLIDGPPALQQVQGQTLMRVINTRALIVLEQNTNRYYLHAMNRWYEAASATGPWAVLNGAPPAGVDALMLSLGKAKTVDLLDPADPAAAPPNPPMIYVSTTPAELIQTAGNPEYTPIAGTKLLYAKNTDSALFMYVTTQKYYALISGRWFTAASLEGPWAYVAGPDLPKDFAKIPPDSPKANVLVSVPGTPQAKEAVIANSIPQTATVNISETHLTVDYDGQPQFKPIEGTEGLSYAVNAALPVVRVDSATPQTYWSVQNGVWFTATSPAGPWVVATSVPPAIYTIPVSSPIHYVTYVQVYGSTPDVVYVGYTPGYMGTVVANDGVVVYGTGYYYPAYVGTTWVGYPPTYGYGAGFAYGPATGFAFGFAAGAMLGGCWAQPYWGPCYGYGHVDINTSTVYSNWHGGVTYANRHYSYNGYTGQSWASGRGAAFNPYSGRASVGGYSDYYNRQTGEFNAQRAGATFNPNTGIAHAGGREVSGNVYNGTADVNRAGATYNTRTDTGVGHYDNNVYASHDGNVYRYNGADGWQQHTSSGWQNAERSNSSFAEQRSGLDEQRDARDVGDQRFESARSAGGWGGGFRGGGGFGGFHGGRR